jgi:hypothetical protein
MIELDNTLKSTKSLCDAFCMILTRFTHHLTESTLESSVNMTDSR